MRPEKPLAGRTAASSSSPDLIRGSKRTPSFGAIPRSGPGMTRTRKSCLHLDPHPDAYGVSRATTRAVVRMEVIPRQVTGCFPGDLPGGTR
jgi:hypothetical protein